MIIQLILGIIIIFLSLYFKKKIRIIKLIKPLTGPKAIPIIGNGLLFVNKSSSEIMQVLFNLSANFGKLVRVWMGPQLNLLVSDPKDIEVILSSSRLIDKSDEYTFLHEWLGDGLLVSTGKKWFSRRKAITPTFHFKILEHFVEIFEQQGDIFIEKLNKFKPTDMVDIYPLVTLYALDVVCESAMGTSAKAQVNSDSKYVEAVKDISENLHLRMFNFLLRNPILFNISPSGFKQRRSLKILHDFTDRVIVQRRKELIESLNKHKKDNNNNNNNNNINSTDDIGVKKKMAMLDVLLQATIDGKQLTNLEIREEVDTFTFEGHDTTTSGISFALYNVAKNPEVQKKLLQELDDIVGDDLTKPMTMSDLNNLHYMELVIKESLRLYPSVPLLGRKVLEDVNINGKIFPADTNIIIHVYYLGRDPINFPEPDKFIPERFDVETTSEKYNPYAYIPFSAGPRNCIGQKFALLEMKSIISKVLRNYELKIPDDDNSNPVLIAPLILRPLNGLVINIKPRKSQTKHNEKFLLM